MFLLCFPESIILFKMIKWIFFYSFHDANTLNRRITEAASEQWTDSITNNYCIPKKHPERNEWAVIIQPGYEQYFTTEELNSAIELTEDWFTFINP